MANSPKPPEHFLVSHLVILPVLPPSVVRVATISQDMPEVPDSKISPPVIPIEISLVTFTPLSFHTAADAAEVDIVPNIVTAMARPASSRRLSIFISPVSFRSEPFPVAALPRDTAVFKQQFSL